jgi:hypothetical protein
MGVDLTGTGCRRLVGLLPALVLTVVFPAGAPTTAQDEAVVLPAPFIPERAITWVEVDLGLEGDLLARANALGDALDLSGRAVPAPARIAKAIDIALETTPFSWARDIRPWTDERVVITSVDPAQIGDVETWFEAGVAGLSVTDAAGAADFLVDLREYLARDNVFGEANRGRWTVTTVTSGPLADSGLSWAPIEDWLLFSTDVDALNEALDSATGRSSLVASGRGRASSMNEASLTAWFDLGEVLDLAFRDPQSAKAAEDLAFIAGLGQEQLPRDLGGYVTLGTDGIEASILLPLGDSIAVPEPRTSDLAASMPASTLAYAEIHDVGRLLTPAIIRGRHLDWLGGGRGILYAMYELEYQLGFEVDDVLDVIEDVAVGLSSESGTLRIGLVASLADAAEARRILETFILSMRTIHNRTDELYVDVYTEEVDGVPVVNLGVSGLQDLAAQGIPLGDSISVAIHDDLLYVGTGGFVRDAIWGPDDGSLAQDSRYLETALGVGTPTLASVFIDLRHGLPTYELITGERLYLDDTLRRELDTVSATLTTVPDGVRLNLRAMPSHQRRQIR